MHKRIIAFVLMCILIITVHPLQLHAAPAVSAQQAVLMDAKTGRVLFEKSAHEKRPIASITKIMTAILAIESGKLDDMVTTSRKAIYTEGSSIYLEQGEKMRLEDLVYGLMLRSGNDAAIAISEHIAGSEEGFVYLMNEKARWLGMTNTSFSNPHGLDEEGHYSTAYDMALLMQYAMKSKLFSKISNTELYRAETRSYSWLNKNKLLTSYYKYCTGGKTGFTKISGRTLVSTAHQNGKDLIAVTLRAPDDWNDHIQLFEYGFESLENKSLEKGQTIDPTFKRGTLEEPLPNRKWRDVFLEVISSISGVSLPWSI